MKTKIIFLIVIINALTLHLVLSIPVLADPHFSSKQEMIQDAEYIGIVQIAKVKPCSVKASNWWDWKSWPACWLDWTYHQRADAVVEKVFKGNLPKEITIYGGEDFTCTHTDLFPGRCLVFLCYDHNFLVGCNWNLSIRPIKEGKLKWYSGEKWYPLTSQPEEKVIADVEETLSKQNKTDKQTQGIANDGIKK